MWDASVNKLETHFLDLPNVLPVEEAQKNNMPDWQVPLHVK